MTEQLNKQWVIKNGFGDVVYGTNRAKDEADLVDRWASTFLPAPLVSADLVNDQVARERGAVIRRCGPPFIWRDWRGALNTMHIRANILIR